MCYRELWDKCLRMPVRSLVVSALMPGYVNGLGRSCRAFLSSFLGYRLIY